MRVGWLVHAKMGLETETEPRKGESHEVSGKGRENRRFQGPEEEEACSLHKWFLARVPFAPHPQRTFGNTAMTE